jgi:hypothetical protein
MPLAYLYAKTEKIAGQVDSLALRDLDENYILPGDLADTNTNYTLVIAHKTADERLLDVCKAHHGFLRVGRL